MKTFLVWLEDKEPFSVEIEAESETAAREKVERMLDENTLLDEISPEFSQSCWEITSVEEA